MQSLRLQYVIMFTNYYRISIKNCFTPSNVAMNTEASDPNASNANSNVNENGGDSTQPLESTVEQQAPESEPLEPKMMDRYECDSCGYIYEPVRGVSESVPPGMTFESIDPSWRCPVCGAPKRVFRNIGPAGSPSGFKENLGYGLGVNTLTPGQKNILIFGALLLAFLFFMSLYGLK